MKRCYRCKIDMPLDQFNKCSSRKDGLQSRCRPCDKEMALAYYSKNKEKYAERNNRYRQETREWVWDYLQTHPCSDCGESDPVVLDFDHDDGVVKKASVATLKSQSLRAVKEEVEKCTVRCANCHRRRTAVQFGWHVLGSQVSVGSARRLETPKGAVRVCGEPR